MQPTSAPVSRTPPVPAIAAAVLGLMSAFVPAIFALAAFAFSGGEFEGNSWLLIVVPILLVLGLLAGAARLLVGRSWAMLAVVAGLLTALLLYGYASGGWGAGFFGAFVVLIPLLTTVLAALPRVRSWVAGRRGARTGSCPATSGPARPVRRPHLGRCGPLIAPLRGAGTARRPPGGRRNGAGER